MAYLVHVISKLVVVLLISYFVPHQPPVGYAYAR
jgi:hypothetical protein